MKRLLSIFAIVFTLGLAPAGTVISPHIWARAVVLQQARGEEPRDGADPISRVVRLLKRLFHVGSNGDGMTPPKP